MPSRRAVHQGLTVQRNSTSQGRKDEVVRKVLRFVSDTAESTRDFDEGLTGYADDRHRRAIDYGTHRRLSETSWGHREAAAAKVR